MTRKKKIPKRLKEYREKRGLTIRALADKSTVSVSTVVRAEGGASVHWSTVNLLANALAVHPQTLLGQRDVWEPDGDLPPVRGVETWEEKVRREERERLEEPVFREVDGSPPRRLYELPACCRDEYEHGDGALKTPTGELLDCFRCSRSYAVSRPSAGRTA